MCTAYSICAHNPINDKVTHVTSNNDNIYQGIQVMCLSCIAIYPSYMCNHLQTHKSMSVCIVDALNHCNKQDYISNNSTYR